ncbi:sigma 54-interacting transcriptional regulator [Flavonifractor sp. AGMB03687]|uniref:sigma-54 interaction domain-containing protein n=1 Tax=Flavonifractor sp. AGMB03687 TaxID=2785133 RepID=UPI001ADF3AF8|nr:sigma 54-interacting transcriptional regulator [Flavonifractor sp. AGMB03687]
MPELQRFGISKDVAPERMRELIQMALVSLGEILILDRTGRMVYISEAYARNMGVSIEEALGRHITEIIPDSRLPQVLKTGKATMGDMYYRNGNAFWVNRMPIWEHGEVVGVVAQSILTSDLESENLKRKLAGVVRELNYYKDKYKQISTARGDLDTIISRSPVMEDLKDTLRMISGTRSTVLITGESGTGKELFACAIHNLSERRDKPFVRLNCAAIPDTLLESELFGYEEGAFTGAVRGGKIGDFEAANGGSIFLDEVDSLSSNMQAKLLRVIQEREIKKVGSTKTIPIDVRFIFATNKDLYQMMKEGKFREDFYYRINVIHLRLPPLRERPEDIIPLTESFLQKFNQELDRQITGLTPAAALVLEQYQWPGNIRELENCIERAFNYTTGSVIDTEHLNLPGTTVPPAEDAIGDYTLKQIRDHAEKTAIQRMLELCGGNKKETAERLGIDRSILYDKIKRYHLNCD